MADGPAVGLEPLAEQANYRMARFVEEEISVVQQEHEPWFGAEDEKQEHPKAKRKAQQLRASYRFPFALFHEG